MRALPNFLGVASLVVLFAYISYNEIRHRKGASRMSDEQVSDPGYRGAPGPLPAISYPLPDNVFFAGEPVPLDIPDVRERFDQELQINIYFHSNTLFLIKRANRWLPQMARILKENGIPDDFKYLPLIESNLLNAISPADAVGYWQILESAGKENGLEITRQVDERYHPLKATQAACNYLKKAYNRFGNWTLVAASYNRGMSGLDRAIENQGQTSYYDLFLNEQTSRYVFRILAIKEIIENPGRYGFMVDPDHYYQQVPLKYIDVDESIDIVEFANKHGTNYKTIKIYNPWLRDEKLTVRRGKNYRIGIPE